MNIRADKTNLEIIQEIQSKVSDYLSSYNIKALIIGISGGFDSGFNAAILKPVCDELRIPLIGAYIHIESNKEEEQLRANLIGKAFCTQYHSVDLTDQFHALNFKMNSDIILSSRPTMKERITMGNVKARMRMIYLYNLAARNGGIVVDNDNKTEHMLGFWTIGGDIGDITPLASFYKTECYELAKSFLETLSDNSAKQALQFVIDAVPTDGLGITSSDVEQFGVSSYNEVDAVLKRIETDQDRSHYSEIEQRIFDRWKNSEFKRHHPHRIVA